MDLLISTWFRCGEALSAAAAINLVVLQGSNTLPSVSRKTLAVSSTVTSREKFHCVFIFGQK
ncbi:Uncharacterized protein APZ42_018421 [Daphnia magna]|uniref:Uncharacterized protein n=1 Tax=Daphnia magna TaxID=35525 RepID=A0A164Z5U9_9CRUS|nr:Uncharacterized protein APZ42_018421 [Daphnia magna]